jgi:hypothetical protein
MKSLVAATAKQRAFICFFMPLFVPHFSNRVALRKSRAVSAIDMVKAKTGHCFLVPTSLALSPHLMDKRFLVIPSSLCRVRGLALLAPGSIPIIKFRIFVELTEMFCFVTMGAYTKPF